MRTRSGTLGAQTPIRGSIGHPAPPRRADRIQRHPKERDSLDRPSALGRGLALLLIVGGLIHLKVAIEHAQNGPFKIIFVAIGTFELGSALATALWPSRSVYALVAVATAILVTSWVVWHTVGLPVPTQTWEPEPSSLWNSLALVSDAIMAESAAILFWSSRRRSSLHWQTRQGPGRATSERSAGLSTGHGHQWLHGVGKPADV